VAHTIYQLKINHKRFGDVIILMKKCQFFVKTLVFFERLLLLYQNEF